MGIKRILDEHLYLLLAVVLFLGVGLLIVAAALPHEWLRHDLLRDFGIALIVSVCITLVLEYHLARRHEADNALREAVAGDRFLNEVMGRIVPEKVWGEVRTQILNTVAICEQWHLRITISLHEVECQGQVQQQHIATGILGYKLLNQTNIVQTLHLSHELESKMEGTMVTDQRIVPSFDQLTLTPSSGQQTFLTGNNLKSKKLWKEDILEIPVAVPPAPGSVFVGLTRREIMMIPGSLTWYMRWTTIQPRITIDTDLNIIVKVLARHPTPSLMTPTAQGKEWQFDGVMLPGQGFEIVCLQERVLNTATGKA